MEASFGHSALSVFDVWPDARDFLADALDSKTAPEDERRRLFDLSLFAGARAWYSALDLTFLIKTSGQLAIPAFDRVRERFPTPLHLANPANADELAHIIRHLGLAVVRVGYIQKYARAFLDNPPRPGVRYRVRNYDRRDVGRRSESTEEPPQWYSTGYLTPDACDDDTEAWEIGHMTQGKYAIDSWRIFCRDEMLGRAEDWNGKGREPEFQPEWMRVMPQDKELRALLRWMWMRDGWEWDPVTGERTVLDDNLRNGTRSSDSDSNTAYEARDPKLATLRLYTPGDMSQRGPSGYGLGGGPAPYGGSSQPEESSGNILDQIRPYTSKAEDVLDNLSEPIKPYLPAIGRFLIVVTFLEDALRIMTQWSEQLLYLHDYRKIPTGITHIFLIVNVIAMVSCSTLVIIRKHSDYAVAGLMGVVVTQALGYGLIFDLNFFLRNLSVIGGLLMVLSDSWVRKTKAFAGLPQIDEKDRKMYFQLAGRVLLIFLFVGFVFSGQWSIWRVVVSLMGAGACVMVVVGFKAKFSATLLVVILSIFNLLVNNFWTLHEHHPHKDFAKYDFFQILSIVGGLLLLVNSGPGQFSIDEKKKVY
ncbi:COPII-coated vesicle protein SurF4/Erv29 [Purpureocillium lavendulum]|uniref:COPII-coated vesicle protein SurF4/Erv29 n=1 Tax=Purpureocillium lavendulum TaxID=1247861 RepID=A0AB34G313_9HYPO|nr:COPII-coated vesicle protein SurF4/Erv29 [Purpureocillium lavendulum]